MSRTKIWVFDVEHGFMAFVRAPSGETLAIDCGKGSDFSPSCYIRDEELSDIERNSISPISQLVVTHPHDDHIEDIDLFTRLLKPRFIVWQPYDWKEVEGESSGGYHNLRRWAKFQASVTLTSATPDWGAMKATYWHLEVDEAKELNASKFINNSSIVTIVEVAAFKMTFPGDIERDGWLKLLERDEFRVALRGTSVFVTSHHGHSSGYAPELYDVMGKPFFNLSSIHRGDLSIENAYSTPDRARGVRWGDDQRYSFTTRTDGSCRITVDEAGGFEYGFLHLGANLPN